MALFEIDKGKLIPAQFGRKINSTIPQDVLLSVRNQVLQVINKPLLPVAWLRLEDIYKNLPSDMPHSIDNQERLVAFDLSGQLVIVEVASVLDSKVLTDSLAFLSRASNLAWKEIAEFYNGGFQSFATAWMKFREQKPMNVSSTPRLILVVDKVEFSIRPALDVLLESGMAIYELDVRSMSNGRMFLDVNQLTTVTRPSNLESMLSISSNVFSTNFLTADVIGTGKINSNNNVSDEVVNKSNTSSANLETEKQNNLGKNRVHRASLRNKMANMSLVNKANEQQNKNKIYQQPSPKIQKDINVAPVPVQFDSQGLAILSALSNEKEISLYLPSICRRGVFGFLRNGEIHAINAVFDDANKAYLAVAEYFMVTLDSRIHPNSGWDAIRLGAVNGPTITEAIREINHKGTVSL